MAVEDLFTLSELGDVAVSPDGERIALTLTRPGNPNGCPTCNYKESGDVWVIERATGARRNLTNGSEDGGSSWMPVWSPDGARLAFVSTRPGRDEPRGRGNIRLHAWDATTGVIRRLTERGICLQVEARAGGESAAPVAWLDGTTLLAAVLQPGVAADQELLYWRRGMAEARRAWARAEDGKEPSASVLESGGAAPDLPTVSLQRIDVATGAAVTLADVPKWDLWDLALNLQIVVSPDARQAAVLAVVGTGAVREPADAAELRTWRCGIVALDAPAPVEWAPSDPRREHLDGSLGEWSPDGGSFFVFESAERGSTSRRALIVSAATGDVRDATPAGTAVGRATWTWDRSPLVRARSASGAASAPSASRWDWWRLGRRSARQSHRVDAGGPVRSLPDSGSGAARRLRGRRALGGLRLGATPRCAIVDLPGAVSLAPLPPRRGLRLADGGLPRARDGRGA